MMQIYRVGDIADKKAYLKAMGVEGGGVAIMAKKMELFYIALKALKTPAANILKQDALSIGAELAVPGGVITCEKPTYDCLLIGTRKHIEILAHKELAQPFGLKTVAKRLQEILKEKRFPVRIMGVLNANDDSFYAGSRFSASEAITRIEVMIEAGADIVDIGAVSSRPGAPSVPVEEELRRLRPICEAIRAEKLYEKALFSIDSYTPEAIALALDSGFGLVNDITGASDERLIELAVRHDASYCIMHMQGTPQTMQKDPHYEDVIAEIDTFFDERIAACEAMGLKRDRLILDVGIGFGKTLAHNLTLLQNLRHFKHFGCELLIGASRKSMIDKIVPSPVEARLPGTLAIHLKALEEGASIIRCHDVAEHKQAVAVYEALEKRK